VFYIHAPAQNDDPCFCHDQIAAIEAEAAARAVDEALLVEAVAEALMVALRREDHPRGYVPRTGVMYDSLAAALVAHLRGPRPEGEG
jgi:hypothetical protein